jgi:CheY-like chemotaxis protein
MPGRVIAVVKDLFFVARIRETARMVGAPLDFARTPDEIRAALAGDPAPALILIDLTTPGCDYGEVFAAIESSGQATPVLGYTTHVLAAQTKPLHDRCTRVVTRETLTRDLGTILASGLAA